jgi:hypothetical protein
MERSRLYREYYRDLTPRQRNEFRANWRESPQQAERKLKEQMEANQARLSLLGRKDLKSSQIEQVWQKAEKFLARAEEYASRCSALRASDAGEAVRKEAELESGYRELCEALRRNEGKIRHTPYSATERQNLLERNSYYLSRLYAVYKRISKSK